MSSRASVAIFVAHFCGAWGWYVLISWLPRYLETLGVATADLPWYAIPPYVANVLGAIVSGWVADDMLLEGAPRLEVRRWMQGISLMGPAIVLLVLTIGQVECPMAVCGWMVAALFLKSFVYSGIHSNILDIAPDHAGQLFGLSNTFATVAGVAGNILTGWLFQLHQSFSGVFLVCCGVYLVGTVTYGCLSAAEPVFQAGPGGQGCVRVRDSAVLREL
eukprot:RCo035082